MRKVIVIVAAVVIIGLAMVAGFAYILYRIGKDMSQFRCGWHENDRGQL